MHCSSLFLFVFAMLLSACGTSDATKADKRDFAVDTYYPTPNEIRLAEQRSQAAVLAFTVRAAARGQSGDHLGDCPALGALGPALADRAHIPVANPGGPDLETALGQLEHFHFGPVA